MINVEELLAGGVDGVVAVTVDATASDGDVVELALRGDFGDIVEGGRVVLVFIIVVVVVDAVVVVVVVVVVVLDTVRV